MNQKADDSIIMQINNNITSCSYHYFFNSTQVITHNQTEPGWKELNKISTGTLCFTKPGIQCKSYKL
jgi:hypothetical protein